MFVRAGTCSFRHSAGRHRIWETECWWRWISSHLIGDDDSTFIKKCIPFFSSWTASIRMRPDGFSPPGIPNRTFRKAMQCHATRVSSPPLYKRGAIRIPTSVTVEGLNACTCSFEYPPSRYQISTKFEWLNTEVMPERMNMLVLDRRRRLYFSKKSYTIF